MEINKAELRKFLVEAKRNTYASGNKAVKLADDFEEFVYGKGDYTYRDRYHANDPRPFGGEEVVWHRGEAIWLMNYYGLLLSSQVDKEKVYSFLREALQEVAEEFPFRGPVQKPFTRGELTYKSSINGNLECFNGTKFIVISSKRVYESKFHGGSL
ncbi:MAG: hypothetical protein RL557_497 [archaeon]